MEDSLRETGMTSMADLDSSSLLLASRRTSAKGTIVQPTVEWPSQQQQIRISSQEALLDPSGGSNQLLIESAGGQLMHHDWPLPQRTQFASVMGGTLGRHPAAMMNPAAASRVPNLQYPVSSTSTFRATAGYPLYHTCERPPSSKKRVTIVEDNNTESSV